MVKKKMKPHRRHEVEFLNLPAQNAPFINELQTALAAMVVEGRFILGEAVQLFEAELAAHLCVKHVIGVSSGTDALLAALTALDVRSDTAVVTTPWTFFATVGSIVRAGARPVFVDIDPVTYNWNVDEVVTHVDAIRLPVHVFGLPALCPASGVDIEDAAQAIAAAPLRGVAGCLSFFPSKNLGCLGDGGAVYTNSDLFAAKIRSLRVHGSTTRYIHDAVGGNFRLDTLQAAFLRIKLPHLPGWIAVRRENAARYRELFAIANPGGITCPLDAPDHTYNQFVIRVPEQRDKLRMHLHKKGIQTEVYWPVPMHLQPCLRYLGYRDGQFPHAERASREALALPIAPEITADQQACVVEQIGRFYERER